MSSIWPQLLLQVILIAINAYFAATEIAVISLNEALIRKQAEGGDRKAAKLLRIVEMPTRFLSTIQIGITLAGFLGSAFAADNLAGLLTQWAVSTFALTGPVVATVHTLSVIVVTVILSFFTLVFGELVPKRVAMKKSEAVARFSCGVVGLLATVMRPLIWLLTVSTNAVLWLLRINPNEDEEEVSEEGLRMLIDLSEEKGAIETDEKEMIENIFEFNNMTAADVMIHRTDMVMLWAEDTPEEIEKTIEESGLSRFPVYEEDADDIIGILSTREWLINARKPQPKPLRELLRPAYFVPQSVRTDLLFRDMQSKKVHLSIVVDEYGGTAGLVTMEDLLEEIVGNIYDEFDPQEDLEIIPLGEDRWRVAGSAELEELFEALGMEMPEEEESETLGGLVYAQLSVIPEDGSHPEVDIYGLHIRVEELSERRVEWATVTKLSPPPEEEEEHTGHKKES
ncbi:hemolysin family protein [uncultured Flavonifractor sp.]|uniref:hemolysin family protein n=1 Tax=uncultured Flavonifractor sp. TaxID=1193534 RepID=UPI0026701E72|nr:hemolysin family protein [uncultured Flavonifractor sp.]